MSRKTADAYYSVLKYVHENLIPLVGAGIIIDFEKAERLAISRLNTGILIYGCWFHFCQALRRKLASMGELFELVRTNENAKNIFTQFQCLALLPADLIEPTFKELAKKALKLSTLFAPFVDYFDREWIKIVKPHHFSVFMRGVRTTGAAESFNHQINQRFKTHGNFFHFCETLQKEEVVIAQQLENYIEGTIQRQKVPTYLKNRHKLIRKHSLMLQRKEISPMVFLATMANRKNHIVYADEDISLNEKEIELSERIELYGNEDDVIYQEFNDSSSASENSDIEDTSAKGKSFQIYTVEVEVLCYAQRILSRGFLASFHLRYSFDFSSEQCCKCNQFVHFFSSFYVIFAFLDCFFSIQYGKDKL